MSRVVLLEPERYNPEALATYARLGSVCSERKTGTELDKELQDAEVIVIKLGKVDAALMAKAPNLKVIASPTTALDHIDQKYAEEHGIKIVSLKGRRDITEKIYATSELTIAIILALLRRIPSAHAHVMQGGWDRNLFIGNEVSGKTIGIVGCGRLGSRVATILQAMGARVIATDPLQPAENIPVGVEMMSLDNLLKQSDIVSVHVILSPETEKMFSAKQFEQMKKGAWFVNTARGQIVDEVALLSALQSGHLAGAALDVMQGEDGDGRHLVQNALREYAMTHDNLLLVPHIGGATKESMGLTELAIAEEVVRVLSI